MKIHRNNSSGWETSPFIRRLRGFGAYLTFRAPIALVLAVPWFYLLGPEAPAPLRVLMGLEGALSAFPGPLFLASCLAMLSAFALAKPLARECMGAVAWATRPVRNILMWKEHGQGGSSGFATLLEEFDSRYRKGSIFLGASLYDPGLLLGQAGQSGLMSFGAARSGKQRSGTIPVCGTWPYSLFIPDAKGQHTNVMYERRLEFGLAYVSAPFGRVNVPTHRWNPMQWLDPDSPTYYEDVCALGESLVVPTDMRNFFFDDSARQIISGCISHVRCAYPEHASLPMVRRMLMADPDTFDAEVEKMLATTSDGGLARAAASRILRSRGSNEYNAVMATVDYNTHWITSKMMSQCLAASDFSLASLQDEPTSLFLVLPVEELAQHGRFLRAFVYCAIRQFSRKKAKVPILMILDEFYSLGTMSFMTKTISNIPGFNVRIWPVCQNYSQLIELYGENSSTWAANANAVSWLSVADPMTKGVLAEELGRYTDGFSYYNLREHDELGKLTSADNGMTVITRAGKSPLLVRRVNYDIAFKKRMFSPDPDHILKGWDKIKHTLQRVWYRINLWI
jgi:type IV secretory pathway TraG/TraD family ATPase VirD4